MTARKPPPNLAASAPRAAHLWPIVILCLATLVTFSPVLGHAFLHWDDQLNLTENPDFTPVTFAGVAKYWHTPYLDLYIPVTYTAWGVLAGLSPGDGRTLDPRLFHAANLLVHVAAACAVYLILRRLRAGAWPACVGALLYALHPLQLEPVAWVSGLKDVLSGALCLWALYAYVRAATSDRPFPWQAPVAYGTASALYVLAMLAKPQAVCLPLVALAIDALVLRRSLSRLITWLGPWLALAVPIVLVARHVQPAMSHAPHVPIPRRFLVAADDLAFYVGKLLAPVRLTIDYGRTTTFLMSSPQRYVTWLVPVAILALAVTLRRRAPWFAAGVAVFAAALLPVLGLVPFDYQAYSNVADHYAYVALLGPALVACFAFARVERDPRARLAAALVLVACAAGSFWQARYWRDDDAIFARALDVTPDSVAGNVNNVNVGIERLHQGRLDDAERLFNSALRVSPGHVGALINLASLRAAQGRVDESIDMFRQILDNHPDNAEAHFDFGNVLWRRAARPGDAIEQYRAALALNPQNPDVHANLGLALIETGDRVQGLTEIQTALKLKPDNAPLWTVLANAQAQAGDVASALRSFRAALQADPNFAPAQQGAAQAERFLNQRRP